MSARKMTFQNKDHSRRVLRSTLVLAIMVVATSVSARTTSPISSITEAEWSVIFLNVTNGPGDTYLKKVENQALKIVKSSTQNMQKASKSQDRIGLMAALRESLTAHLLAWYGSELSTAKGTLSWSKERIAILEQRSVFFQVGVDLQTLETSFLNMNKAAKKHRLPTVSSLN